MKSHNNSFAFKKPFGRVEIRPEGWTDGDVVTYYGIVSVYAQGDEDSYYSTGLQFAYEGRLYGRTFLKRYTPRGIVTKANEFVQDVIRDSLPF